MPGIDSISSRTPSPATTKAGWIRCDGGQLGLADEAAQGAGAAQTAQACGGEGH